MIRLSLIDQFNEQPRQKLSNIKIMNEIKCPECGKVFSVDEASYASIVNQVRTKELEDEVRRRIAEMEKQHDLQQQSEKLLAAQNFQQKLNAKEQELERRNADIARLEEQVKSVALSKQTEFDKILAEKDAEIIQLKGQVAQSESKTQVAVLEEKNKANEVIHQKESEIATWKGRLDSEKNDALRREKDIRENYEQQLKQKQEMVDYYKDLKTKMSTKMVGETLEAHCSIEFEQYIRPMMPNAYFDKDNDAADGTKGDFIFRDSEDGTEYISIMFEMKNEMDTTATKHKNDDFLKKLDEDRRKKGCEFAVLVSLLEAENDLYNNGIVNKSHLYPKMYVIRPQFFVPFINLLVQTSKKSLEYKKQLILAQSKEVDVTNFENKMEEFKSKFGRHYELASRKFEDAVKQIDDTIAKLLKVKENLLGSENNLRLAQQDTEDLTIRKLTFKNPTMKMMFDEARKNNREKGTSDENNDYVEVEDSVNADDFEQ